MVWFLYYLLMYLFLGGMLVAAVWNPKAKLWVKGRKDWVAQLKLLPEKTHPRIWFHVSSLGEFEQARPVIEKLKANEKEIEIILTFFSPSGYLIRSDYALAHVFYLPADLPGIAKKWLSIVQPDLAVFVKYDLWPGYLRALKQRDIPAILFSAHWTRGQMFASHRLPPTRSLLFQFKQIFLQQENDLSYFRNKGYTNISVAGDTRIDRSLDLPKEAKSKIPVWLNNMPPFDLVAGSTWPPDEKLISEAYKQLSLRILIAPHDVSKENIDRLLRLWPSQAVRLSDLPNLDITPAVVIVDSIGVLAYLYSLGQIAYVGGGFGSGIHNTLEPMAHGKPVIFGPTYKRFPEAFAMVQEKSAISVNDHEDLIMALKYFSKSENLEKAQTGVLQYLLKHKGASEKVANYILDSIPFSPKV